MLKKKKKKGEQHLKKKGKERGHHRVLSTRTCAFSACMLFRKCIACINLDIYMFIIINVVYMKKN